MSCKSHAGAPFNLVLTAQTSLLPVVYVHKRRQRKTIYKQARLKKGSDHLSQPTPFLLQIKRLLVMSELSHRSRQGHPFQFGFPIHSSLPLFRHTHIRTQTHSRSLKHAHTCTHTQNRARAHTHTHMPSSSFFTLLSVFTRHVCTK